MYVQSRGDSEIALRERERERKNREGEVIESHWPSILFVSPSHSLLSLSVASAAAAAAALTLYSILDFLFPCFAVVCIKSQERRSQEPRTKNSRIYIFFILQLPLIVERHLRGENKAVCVCGVWCACVCVCVCVCVMVRVCGVRVCVFRVVALTCGRLSILEIAILFSTNIIARLCNDS